MKIISHPKKLIYDIEFRKSGENQMPCPECNNDRKHKGKKSFSFNAATKIGYCMNCQAKFFEFKPYVAKKEYKLPEQKNNTGLTDKALNWFEGRMISQKTLNKLGVYSSKEWMPQTAKDESVICFPYFIDGKLVNIKYRDGAKNFKLVKDAELVFFNIDALKTNTEIIITEGEIDCLSFIESGHENCISVPNGASSKNLEYIDNHIDKFDNIEKIYLAVDNDAAGLQLREELIRRFGQEKCSIILFNDCKDANEYLQKHGGVELSKTVANSIDIPVSGIVNLGSYYDEIYSMFISGLEQGKTTGTDLDAVVTWELGRLAVITGIPGHGKSEFLDFIVTRLNVLHGYKAGYFSPENYPIKYHYSKIASKLTGKEFHQYKMSTEEYEQAYDYISDNFFFIYPEDDMSFNNIIEKAKYLVKKQGIKILVIDPYNKIEHMRDRNESETEYISRFLDRMTSFAKQFNVLVFLVAHPRKMDKNSLGIYNVPNLYDINGSANFYNKCDYGISVYRDFQNVNTQIHVIKVKFRHLGNGGLVLMKYNYNNGRYENNEISVDRWNNSNYMTKAEVQQLPVNTQFDEVDHRFDSETAPF